ncbi:peptidoglycan DD-metalloendopeptidase family protein [Pleomorphovibrio marinus]|uniref:peptidoglycan DD-metalloendopeptidase family protein n=1 Tax=Pleomorphovibrio marinus TaxID=2164132 RepID=UPI000E0C312F|nr:peptidoglycan DD-metalloendopeptidase family protein [Pleomorphovibrio marinus]
MLADFYPLMGVPLTSSNTEVLDLSAKNTSLNRAVYQEGSSFENFITHFLKLSNKPFAIGGYLENRSIYSRSEVFSSGKTSFRNIHMGIDIWSFPGAPVFCPLEGRIHSFQDNMGFGNYGPTLILEHELQGRVIYSLYGHLSRADMGAWQAGMTVIKGTLLGHLGALEENGCWPAHLHFQLIHKIGEYRGDYPGVCMEVDMQYYKQNCPDPNKWINYPHLK